MYIQWVLPASMYYSEGHIAAQLDLLDHLGVRGLGHLERVSQDQGQGSGSGLRVRIREQDIDFKIRIWDKGSMVKDKGSRLRNHMKDPGHSFRSG